MSSKTKGEKLNLNRSYAEIKKRRQEIDDVTLSTAALLLKRLKLVEEVGKLKKERNLPVLDVKRENELIKGVLEKLEMSRKEKEYILTVLGIVINESRRIQGFKAEERSKAFYNLFIKAKELETLGKKVVHLEVGEPCYGPPEEAINALKDSLTKKNMSYSSPTGLEEVKKAIIEKVNEENSLDFANENIVLTPGGKFGIYASITTNIKPGEKVIIFNPSWPVYGSLTMKAKGLIGEINTELEKGWRIDSEKLKEEIDENTKMIIINNPCNPTGKIYGEKELEEIVQLAEEKKLLVLADETYSKITFKPFKTVLEFNYENTIYVDSFSKTYGMTGFRLGYAIGKKEIIDKISSLISLTVTCVPPFIQKAGLAVLETEKEKKYKEFMKGNISLTDKLLKNQPVKYMKPEGGLYFFIKVLKDKFNSLDFAEKLLEKKRVAVAPGTAFGQKYTEFIRINVSTRKEDLFLGLKELCEAF